MPALLNEVLFNESRNNWKSEALTAFTCCLTSRMDMMGRNRSPVNRYLLLSSMQNILMQTLRSLRKGILDMTQHSRVGYGKERMTRYSELCVYGIREI